jgi:hypothetical protein
MEFLNRNSSEDHKQEMSYVLFERLSEYFFDKIVFVSLPYSDLGVALSTVNISGVDYLIQRSDASRGTNSVPNFGVASRIIDTTRGRLMAPGKTSRLRCSFYLRRPDVMEGYILSPAVYDSQGLPNPLTNIDVLRSYVGIKIDRGQVFVAVKEAGGQEILTPIDFELTMDGANFTDTFGLEIRHNVSSTDIYINDEFFGSYSSDLAGNVQGVETFYSFFAPARSTDGTLVNIVAENIQFIQDK